MCITVCVMAVTNGMVKFSSKHCLGAVGDSTPEPQNLFMIRIKHMMSVIMIIVVQNSKVCPHNIVHFFVLC